MGNPWAEMTAAHLGFPKFPAAACSEEFRGRLMQWINGVRTDMADWYFLRYSASEIKNYIRAGGDPGKLVIHHLTYDEAVINPLWGTDTFMKRAELMHELGVKYVVGPDFSSWADEPYAVQLYNYYRSMVVTCDFAKAGFVTIPNVTWSAPALSRLTINMWPPNMKAIVIDVQHMGPIEKESFNQQMVLNGGLLVREWIGDYRPHMILVGTTPKIMGWWRANVCENSTWLPSRGAMVANLSDTIKKATRRAG